MEFRIYSDSWCLACGACREKAISVVLSTDPTQALVDLLNDAVAYWKLGTSHDPKNRSLASATGTYDTAKS